MLGVVTLLLVSIAAAADAEPPWRWMRPLAFGEQPTGLAVDGTGDVVVIAGRGTAGSVRRLAGGSGKVRWRLRTPVAVHAVAIGANDDPVVGGTAPRTGRNGNRATVARLARRSGDTVWVWNPDAAGEGIGYDAVAQVLVDAQRDVVVGGDVEPEPATRRPYVVKLDGLTGAERWRFEPPAGCSADRLGGLVLGPGGQPIVALQSCGAAIVAALDPDTGLPVWERAADAAAATLAVAPGDRVAVHTADGDGIDVRMLDAVSGDELWRWVPGGETLLGGYLMVASTGEVLLTMRAVVVFPGGAFAMRPTVLALDGASGAERWRLPAGAPGSGVVALTDALAWIDAEGTGGSPAIVRAVHVATGDNGGRRVLRGVGSIAAAAATPDGTLLLAGRRTAHARRAARGYVGLLRTPQPGDTHRGMGPRSDRGNSQLH